MQIIAPYKCQIIIAGDLNIHVERCSEAHSVRLNEINNSFGYIQQVPHVPTQCEGGTLDLVIMKSNQSVSERFVDSPSIISDHRLIHWCLPFTYQSPIIKIREVKSWCKENRDDFISVLCLASTSSAILLRSRTQLKNCLNYIVVHFSHWQMSFLQCKG